MTKIDIPNTVISIGNSAFYGCTGLTSIIIPDSVVSIGDSAFIYCESLTNVTIPNSVTSIGDEAFYGCTNLTNMIIPTSIASIGNRTFRDCTNLTNITIPKSVVSIGQNAFYHCNNLKDVYYGGSEEEWNTITSYYKDIKYDLVNATIHYNSTGMGAGSEVTPDPGTNPGTTPSNPNPPLKNDDISIKKQSVNFYPQYLGDDPNSPSRTSILLDIDWGWNMFFGSSTSYNSRLGVAGLILSRAAEQSQTSAENTLKALGFQDVDSYYYNMPWYQVAQPGTTFGHKKLIVNGKEQHIFAIVIRGTTNVSDLITDITSIAGSFEASVISVCARLADFMESCGLDSDGDNYKFFVTGHSLGGAVSNLTAFRLNSIYGVNNVFAYTFAAPPCTVLGTFGNNIYNILNVEDAVPSLYTTNIRRYGNDVWFNRDDYPAIYSNFSTFTNGKNLHNYLDNWWESWKLSYQASRALCAHSADVYMSYLMARGDAPYMKVNIITVQIQCPVDVEVYAATSEGQLLVASVKDNVADNTLPVGLSVRVDGDQKYIYLLQDGEYTIKLIATDEGKMSYSIQNVDITTGEVLTEKAFTNVDLTVNKEMTSSLAVNNQDEAITDIPNIWLYVVDDTRKPEKVVLPDDKGTEVSLNSVYAITFDTDGGTLVNRSNPDYAIKGIDYKMPNATKSGYTLKHWAIGAKDSTITAKVNDVYEFTADTTVYVIWDKNSSTSGTSGGSSGRKPQTTTTTTKEPETINKPSNTDITAENINTIFRDVMPNNWYVKAVAYVYNNELMNGTSTDMFSPNDNTTRGQIVTILYRLHGEPDVTNMSAFSDVGSGQYYAKPVAWAAANGIVNGYSETQFAPDDKVTREQLAAILYRYTKFKGEDVSVKGNLNAFSDSSSVATWAEEAMQWAVGAGIINGDNGALNPTGNATRAEVATMIMRMLEK